MVPRVLRRGVRSRPPAAKNKGPRANVTDVAEFAKRFTARYGEAVRRLAGR